MRLTVIESGSDGNCYLLTASNGQTLVIELGVKFIDVKKAMDFNISNIIGSIVTHAHGDHSKGVREAMNAGVEIYMSRGCSDTLGISGDYRIRNMKHLQKFKIGEFEVLALDAKHDSPETLMFVIGHPEMGVCLFLTDSYYMPYKIPGLTNIMIEANFCEEIISEKLSGKKFLRDRVIENHLSLQICKDVLRNNDLSQVNNIILLHLSSSNSDAIRFEREIIELTGKTVNVAVSGLVVESFGSAPF